MTDGGSTGRKGPNADIKTQTQTQREAYRWTTRQLLVTKYRE